MSSLINVTRLVTLSLGLAVALTSAAQAAVTTNYALYRLGEDEVVLPADGADASVTQKANTVGTTFQDLLYKYNDGNPGTAAYSTDTKAGSGSTRSVLLTNWGGWANNSGGTWATGTDPSIAAMEDGNWGLEVYVKTVGNQIQGDGRIFQNGRGPVGGQWSALQATSSGTNLFREGDGGNNPGWTAAALTDNEWHSLVLVQRSASYVGDKFYVYYDGNFVFSDSTMGQTGTPQSMFMLGGADGSLWTGYLDEFRVFTFDESATNAQILAEVNLEEAPGVPEPSTFVLAGLGLAGLGLVAWRRRRRS